MKSVGERGLSQLGKGKGDKVSRREGVRSAKERERGRSQSERRGKVSWREGKGMKSVGEKGLSQLERGKGDEVSRREGV